MRDQFRRSPTLRAAVPATMTPDKQNNGHPGKPLTPSLSAAFNRSSKSPLTPKLANSGAYPTPRRPVQVDTTTVISSREDVSNSTYLSVNITPRSAPRNSRRDGTASPPVGSPGLPYYMQQTTRSAPGAITGGHHRTERSPGRGNARLEPPRPLREKTSMTESHPQISPSRPDSSCGSSAGSPMFFHADDARSSVSSFEQDSRPRSYVKSAPTVAFLYANGTKENESQADDMNKTLPVAKRRSTGPSRPIITTKPHPVLSPRLRSPQLPDSNNRQSFDGHLLASPQIDDFIEIKSPRQQVSYPNSPEQRPSSVASLPAPHRRTTSVDLSHQTTPQRERRRTSSSLSPAFPPPEVTTAAAETPESRPRVVSNGSSFSLDPSAPIPLAQSPVKTEANGQEITDAAINARTERKVLDLEISNSSLLAINRTLERELRKQQAELRRYRRLSRTGRLSISTSIRSTSGAGLSIVSETDDGISEQASIHTPEELSDSGDDDSSITEESTAPDEKRFSLDLSKHQELLVDSQKMNQSLKRCLGWTEELIKEGKKALEYNVQVSDIELGGRVLAPDELSDIGESARALLSPYTEIPTVYSDFDWEGSPEPEEA